MSPFEVLLLVFLWYLAFETWFCKLEGTLAVFNLFLEGFEFVTLTEPKGGDNKRYSQCRWLPDDARYSSRVGSLFG